MSRVNLCHTYHTNTCDLCFFTARRFKNEGTGDKSASEIENSCMVLDIFLREACLFAINYDIENTPVGKVDGELIVFRKADTLCKVLIFFGGKNAVDIHT